MNGPDARIASVMARLETRRDAERAKGRGPIIDDAGRDLRMRSIGPEAGQLLNVLLRSLERPRALELGSSFGYSGLWLAEAARASGGHVLSLECDLHKSEHARQMAAEAGLTPHIEHRTGDALEVLKSLEDPFDFVFLDLWKDLYLPCLELFAPKLAPGAIVVADNISRPGSDGIRAYVKRVRSMSQMQSLLLPVGSGMEISRFQPDA